LYSTGAMKLKIITIIGIVAITTGIYFYQVGLNKQIREIKIAVVGPMDQQTDAGNTFLRAARLVIDEHNKKNTSQGFKFVLEPYNDRNQPDEALKQAKKIAGDPLVLGVIGHNYSSASLKGGEIYKEQGIPAISPTATNVKVTQDNDWYFRTVFTDDDQGQFLANYTKVILKRGKVIIIHEDLEYGRNLAKIFADTANTNGIAIEAELSFQVNNENNEVFDTVIDKIAESNSDALIFLATHYQEGIELVKRLRDRGLENSILTPDAFAHQGFADGFASFPKEIGKPGYYSNDIYVALPIHYDVANFKAQQFFNDYVEKYGLKPDWRAAFAYDAALLFVHAIEKTHLTEKETPIADQRQMIRDFLKGINQSDRAIEGVTGLNYFDDHGNPVKPIVIGQYKDREIVPALTQLKPVGDVKDIPNLEETLKDELIIRLNDEYMYKTNIVFTGIHINAVKDIDMDELTYMMDFDLWFRYSGTVDVRDVIFLNQDKPIQLRAPLEELQFGDQLYRRYRVVGRFKADFLFPSGPQKHVLGVSFSHNSIPRDNLIFVPDQFGGAASWNQIKTKSNRIISSKSSWSIHQLWSFQNVDQRDILGNIKYINAPSKKMNYSQFTTSLEIKDKAFDFRNTLVSFHMAIYLLVFSVILGFVFDNRFQVLNRLYRLWLRLRAKESVAEEQKVGYSYSKDMYQETQKTEKRDSDTLPVLISRHLGWAVTSIALILTLFSVEIALVRFAYRKVDAGTLDKIIEMFGLLWWIIPTHIISSAIHEFFWTYIESKSRHSVPGFLKGLVTFILFILMSFGVMAIVYDQKVTSILGTSGIFVMIIGLAIQMNISNIFAGMVLNVEHSIKVGDWIKIGNGDEGKVLEINWRTTKIQTRNDIVLHIPNNTISESQFQNFTNPQNLVCMWFFIDLDKNVPFDKVRTTILKAMDQVELVLKDPSPSVKFNQFTHWSAKYTIVYSIDDYGKKNLIKGQIWESVLHYLKEERIYSANMTMNLDSLMLNDG
jgi:potassium-dependent mechanosensitive channel